MRTLFFDGRSSADFGIIIGSDETFDAAGRDVEEISIPGRNGAVVRNNRRYKMKTVVYDFVIRDGLKNKAESFRNFLLALPLGFRLEDSRHPDEYYEAYYKDEFRVDPAAFGRSGSGRFTIHRQPERWLKSAEQTVTVRTTGTINNETPHPGYPLFRCYGSGTLQINDASFTVQSAGSYTDIDCLLELIHEGAERRGQTVSRFYWEDVLLRPGTTSVSVSGFSKVEITPRCFLL